jgi:hypothetical protein
MIEFIGSVAIGFMGVLAVFGFATLLFMLISQIYLWCSKHIKIVDGIKTGLEIIISVSIAIAVLYGVGSQLKLWLGW